MANKVGAMRVVGCDVWGILGKLRGDILGGLRVADLSFHSALCVADCKIGPADQISGKGAIDH